MSTSVTVLQDVSATTRMLSSLKSAGMADVLAESAEIQATILLEKMARCTSVSMDEVATIAEKVSSSDCWPHLLKQRLCRGISGMGCSQAHPLKTGNTTQVFDPLGYVNDNIMGSLARGQISKAKIESFVHHLHSLGVTKPSEKSIQKCVAAFMLMVVEHTEIKTMMPSTLFQILSDFKMILRSLKTIPPPEPALDEYPGLAMEFKIRRPKTYEAVFGTSPPSYPIPSIFDSAIAVGSVIPLRKTKRMDIGSSSSIVSAGSANDNMMMQFINIMQHAIRPPLQRLRSSPDLDIQYLGAGSPRLALHDGSPGVRPEALPVHNTSGTQEALKPAPELAGGELLIADGAAAAATAKPTEAAAAATKRGSAQALLEPLAVVSRARNAVIAAMRKRKADTEEKGNPEETVRKKPACARPPDCSKERPPVPDCNEKETIFYLDGKILVQPHSRYFRVFPDAADLNHDYKCPWKDDPMSAWDRVCTKIEAGLPR
jgi:hypothetical protein